MRQGIAAAQDAKSETSRAPYEQPQLKVYGSVRLLTQGTGSNNGDSGQTMMIPCDPCLKENVVEIGRHPLGFGLYLFDYKPEHRAAHGHGRRFGVMADEVARIVPAAVHVAGDGFMRVDYSQLGIRLGA